MLIFSCHQCYNTQGKLMTNWIQLISYEICIEGCYWTNNIKKKVYAYIYFIILNLQCINSSSFSTQKTDMRQRFWKWVLNIYEIFIRILTGKLWYWYNWAFFLPTIHTFVKKNLFKKGKSTNYISIW